MTLSLQTSWMLQIDTNLSLASKTIGKEKIGKSIGIIPYKMVACLQPPLTAHSYFFTMSRIKLSDWPKNN